jgi:hypothetical protein
MANPQALLLELKAQVDAGDVDGGLSALSKIKVRNLESRKPSENKVASPWHMARLSRCSSHLRPSLPLRTFFCLDWLIGFS